MRASFVMSGVASGLRRNLSMTVALVLNTAIALAFAGGALLVSKEITKFKANYENKLNVSIYLCGKTNSPASPCKHAITDAERRALQSKLQSDPRVKAVTFVDEAGSYQRGKKILPPEDAKFLTPGVLPALFIVKLNDLKKDYKGVASSYATATGVDDVQNQSDSLKALLTIFDKSRIGAAIVAIAIMICAMLLMANAIQVAASQRRAETGIMRLVGASRWMVQLPFMIEAVIAAAIGGVVAIILDWVGKLLILDGIFKQQVEHNVLPSLNGNDVLVAGGAGALVGLALAAVTAFVTLRLLVRL
jgi:cell division transport system permease protein